MVKKEHLNTGVSARVSDFSILSSPSHSMMKANEKFLNKPNEVDKNISTEETQIRMPHMSSFQDDTKCLTDTDAEYYMMKSEQRKGQRGSHPSKIEFQMVNSHLKNKLQRTYHPHYVHDQMPYYTPSCHMQNEFKMQQHQQEKSGCGSLFSKLFSQNNKNSNDELQEKEEDAEQKKINKEKFYFFDRGDSEFLRTTDNAPHLVTADAADQVSLAATKFWAEFFGSINVGVTFFIVFFLQLYRFILYSILQSIIVGFFQMTSDYLLKPILTALFNGLFQPFLLLFQNIFHSLWCTLEPLSQMLLGFCIPLIECLRAIRLVDININSKQHHDEIFNRKNYITEHMEV
ncbi:hypothetical protein PVAND_008297 [Polypedilum vanderplanki]|uniref:Transmembrane protein n=1 Tax=Polypedilum vanderplanki TaxID=319348 RepID=A0A9J6C974_POLVA|nr:hypothetical protein PVAND_008297 [Polypedilum vanderplanki]